MFETAELGQKLARAEFEALVPQLHTGLLQAQRILQESSHRCIILVSGVEGAGKGEVVDRLNEWLDSRGIQTSAFWDETDDQKQRPRFWRFWQAMPPRGCIGIMFGSWYTMPIIDRVYNKIDEAEYERQLQEIVEFERMLALENTIIIKLWFHLSKDQVKKQLKADQQNLKQKLRKNPYSSKFSKLFDRFKKVSEVAIRATDKEYVPWHVIEASDSRYRDFTTGKLILDVLQSRIAKDVASISDVQSKAGADAVLAEKTAGENAAGKKAKKVKLAPTVLDVVDLSATISEENYKKQLAKWQRKLNTLSWQAREQGKSVVVLFEGWDAAGKGSTIRRLTRAIDSRLYKVISVAAPTDEEAAQHYLWRFWRHLPLAGYFSIYDRSWYGRVLVERVEKFASEEQWNRAYNEINLFEQQMSEHGIVLLKFWLHLSPQEQLRRFEERAKTPWKMHKITEEDWRNREKWNDYALAVNDMVERTSTAVTPWHLIPGNDKKYARIEVIKTLCRQLQKALKT